MDSILTTIKKMFGISEDDTSFDTDLIININSVLMILKQMGVGPETYFFIQDKTAVWSDFIGERTDLEAIKTYVFLKVRLMFDPPSSSFVLDSIKNQISELEFRLNIQAEV